MKYLLDSNIFLELLLEQERAGEVRAFLERVEPESLCISDFSLYSIGIILLRSNLHEVFERFAEDLLIGGDVCVLRAAPEDMPLIAQAAKKSRLDFDDAYQCVLAAKHGLTIVSFDADFDRTEKGRIMPADINS